MSTRRIKTPEAFEFLYAPKRAKVAWGGRGGAKSWAFADALLAMANDRELRILCAREIQDSIKDSVYQLLVDRARLGQYPITPKVGEIEMPNGSRFIFSGLWRNIDSIKSLESVDICWVEEANTVSEDTWRKLMPTIRKPGSEIWISFNPELKSDPVYQRFIVNPPPYAEVRKVSWRDNPWFTDEMRMEMEHLKATNYDEYLHVWEGELKKFADGAIYAAQIKTARKEGRIGNVPIERTAPVNVFWDLGRNDTTALVLHQRVGLNNRFIRGHECRLVGLDYYANWLRDFARDKGIIYGKHYLPHDVEVTELTSNMSRRETLERLGVKPIITVPRIQSIEEGIAQTRRAFDSCWFDAEGCAELIEALSNYRYVYDEKYDTYRKTPLHDWSSNYADAFRQFGQGYSPDRGWDAAHKPSDMSRRRAEKLKPAFRPSAKWVV